MKSNVVNKKDYELYLMNVPMTLFGKKRRQYIKRELEKVHPCFSEQFSFDSKRCIRKGKVQTLIAVMDKVKVLEYKRNRSRGLHLEGVRAGSLFSNNKKILSAFVLAVIIMSFVIIRSVGKKNAVKGVEDIQLTDNGHDFVVQASPVVQEDKGCREVLEGLFARIKEGGGQIQHASIEMDESDANSHLVVGLSLKKMYPEKLSYGSEMEDSMESSISLVTYSGDEPCFDYSGKAQVVKTVFPKPDGNLVSELRDDLNRYGDIREEDFANAGFYCRVSQDDFVPMFEKINSMEKAAVKTLSVSKNDNGFDLFLEFFESGEERDRGFTQAISNYSSLFVQQKKIPVKVEEKKVTPKKIVGSGNEINSAWEQVGKVVQKNGKTIVYYRDEKNQIIGVEE